MQFNLRYPLQVVAVAFLVTIHGCISLSEKKAGGWLQNYDFDATLFNAPSQQFGPLARWWWPGNDVTEKELKREVDLFADNAFGGVEVQTLTIRLPITNKEQYDSVMSWDTPPYYENLATVMKEARKRDMIVDITNGSSWPTGGPYLSPAEGFITLAFASQDITGGSDVAISVPAIENHTGVPSRLEAVLAVKARPKIPVEDSKTVPLDSTSTLILTDHVKNDTLYWSAPAGNWKVIAFRSRPQNLVGSQVAGPKQGPVLNHFDSVAVKKNYEYLFGKRTGLEPYYGNPMRAIFTDSYEFVVDRHYSHDFISYFKKKRGYDITPWLPVNMQKGYNYVSFKNPNAQPDFAFGSEDWRIRYDYDVTLGELFDDHFIKTSSSWTEKSGLLFRTQPYGIKMDNIACAGHASIPETEGICEAFNKIQTSGAHLYNRPVISCETGIFMHRAYMTTPQKLRLVVDKLFASGVNQIIYHGVPYRYKTEHIIPEGWYPFGGEFASNLGEGNIFWKYQKDINEYIGRVQYALRSGKPRADVLIYLPSLRNEDIPFNPDEILKDGCFESVEPPLSGGGHSLTDEDSKWTKVIYPFINQLEANGYTWDWVNDASILEAKLDDDKQINIRGNHYQSLVLVDTPVIELATAKKINALAKKGMNFLAVGDLPDKQPSYLNWKTNDHITKQHIVEAVSSENSLHISGGHGFDKWFQKLEQSVKFNEKYPFAHLAQREMSDGSRIQFIWNQSDIWQPFSLTLDKKYKSAYWLNAETGTIIPVENMKSVSYVIPPYSTIILYACTKSSVPSGLLSKPEPTSWQARKILEIGKWDVSSGTISVKDTQLFDWKTNTRFKYSSHEGLYNSSFQLNEFNPKAAYFIDMGKVFFTAEVKINGKYAGKRINAPYRLNIAGLLKKGKNTIEIRVTLSQLNGFIGEGLKGNKLYLPYVVRNDGELMPSGMVGPVVLHESLASNSDSQFGMNNQMIEEKGINNGKPEISEAKEHQIKAAKVKWIDKSWFKDDDSSNEYGSKLYAYISGKDDSTRSLRFHIRYHVRNNELLFIKNFMISVDGKTYRIGENVYGEIKTESSGRTIWEMLDREVDSKTFEILKAIANGKNVEIRYSGKDYYKERSISSNEKLELRNVLDTYKALGGKP